MQKFSIFPAEVMNQYVTYVLTVSGQSDIYHIGACRYGEVLQTPDARKKSAFVSNQSYDLTITGIYPDRVTALKAQSQALANAGNITTLNRASITDVTVIVCNETQRIYRTIADTANGEGVHQSALSNHLNGKPGYRHVNKKTFRRIKCDNPKTLARLRIGETLTLADMSPAPTIPATAPLPAPISAPLPAPIKLEKSS